MPMPARDLWSQIQKQLRGRAEDEQLRILRRHLGDLHDEWKGPYKDLRDRLRRNVARLEGHAAVRGRGGQADPFHVKRQGDARVVVTGLPNAGKSALVAGLTGAAAVVADYPFATQHPVPGMLAVPGGVLQLLDTPPIMPGLADGQGAGRALLHVLAQADALVIAVDLSGASADPVEAVETVLAQLTEACVVPLGGPPATVLKVRGKGGVTFSGSDLERDQESEARTILAAAHIDHAEVRVRTAFDTAVLQSQVDGDVPMPVVLAGTRADAPGAAEALAAVGELWPGWPCLGIETDRPETLESLPPALLAALGTMEVFVLERPADTAPEVLTRVHLGDDVAAVAERVGVPAARLKGARVWGGSVPRPGQSVGLDHGVRAGDRIFLQS